GWRDYRAARQRLRHRLGRDDDRVCGGADAAVQAARRPSVRRQQSLPFGVELVQLRLRFVQLRGFVLQRDVVVVHFRQRQLGLPIGDVRFNSGDIGFQLLQLAQPVAFLALGLLVRFICGGACVGRGGLLPGSALGGSLSAFLRQLLQLFFLL